MKTLAFCLTLLIAFPANGQVFATPEQEIADLKTQAVNLQNALDALTQRVMVLETQPLQSVLLPTAAFVDFAPGMLDSAITCAVVANTPTVCNVIALSGAYDVNGDDLTVTVVCDAGTHNGMEYTGPGGNCEFEISDGSGVDPKGQLTVTVNGS